MSQYNVYNQSDITAYLNKMASGDAILAAHLQTALSKPLAKEQEYLKPINEMPTDAPQWLTQEKWKSGSNWHKFIPNNNLDQKVRHVADWIKAAMVNNDEWLKNTDAQGKPKALVEIGRLEHAVGKADKAMRRGMGNADSMLETAKDVQEIHSFNDGYRIVRLLTPQALDRESAMMGHCLGNGAYDDDIKGERYNYYSLRDKNNTAHATFEADTGNNTLLQCKGKENKPPVSKYMPYVKGVR